MFSRLVLKTLLFATILLVIGVAVSAAASGDQPANSSVGAIHTYLMPDLTLRSAFVAPASTLPPVTLTRKTCRCSCGTAPCARDADCGGGEGSCSAFISCCARGESAQLQSGQSSRKTELPAFKGSCN